MLYCRYVDETHALAKQIGDLKNVKASFRAYNTGHGEVNK